jgi:hypothetical protein
MGRCVRVFGSFASLIFAQSALGAELFEIYESPRSLGMGGATTAIANDDSAIFTNPAGISRTRKAWSRNALNMLRFPNLVTAYNNAGRAFYQGSSTAQKENAEQILEEAEKIADKPFYARAGAFPVAILEYGKRPSIPYAIGAYSNSTAFGRIASASPDQAYLESISDVGGVLTFGYTGRSNRVSFAGQVRGVTRYAYEESIPTVELYDRSALSKRIRENANIGTGIGVDAGMLLTVGDFWFPTIGFSALNLPTGCKTNYLNPYSKQRETVCGTVYSGTIKSPDAKSTVDPSDFRVGVAITPRLDREYSMRIGLDAHHLALLGGSNHYGLGGIDAIKLVHGGVEFFFGNPLLPDPVWSLRGGMSQGYSTFGATARIGFLALEGAVYGRDISDTAAPEQDRRYSLGLTGEF